MKKRIISILLSLTIVVSVFSVLEIGTFTSKAAETLEWGDFNYIIDSDNEITIKKYSGKAKCVVVPSEIDGLPVTKIGDHAFASNKEISEVVLNDNLIILENYVFDNCQSLEKINFPSELIYIGDFCFFRTKISNINFGKKLKEIGSFAFSNCGIVGTVDLSSVENIGSFAFSANEKLREVILGEKLTQLEERVFSSCYGLKKINFPKSLVTIGDSCFSQTGLRIAVFGENLRGIGARTFENCVDLNEIYFPESLEKIGNFAFAEASVETLTIPKNLTVIGFGAFQNCRKLETLRFYAENCTVDKYLYNSPDLDMGDIENSAPFLGCNIKYIHLGENITSIGGDSDTYGAFEDCTYLEEILIPDTVSEIGKASFKNCSSLEIAIISDSVTTVADDAFDGCNNLTIVCFEDSYIHEYALNNGIAVSTFLVSPIPNQTYTGKKITPPVTVAFSGETLHKYIDFGVTYENNINVGEADVTVKGKGDYKVFSNKTKFSIVTKNIASTTISPVADQAYTGKEITPDVIVSDSSGILCEDKDYLVSYSNNKKEGTATVIVTGIGNYSGTVSAEFEIVKMNDTENFFNRTIASIKAFFIKVGVFFRNIFGISKGE